MQLHIIPSLYFAANAMVILPEPSGDDAPVALIVDPSFGVQDKLRAVLDQAGARLGAVLLTHGHPDHVWDSAEVASWGEGDTGVGQVPVWLPSPDRYRMENPGGNVSNLPLDLFLPTWTCPADVRDMPAGSVELVPGLWMKMVPAPGHTEGSALFIAHSPLDVYRDGEVVASSQTPIPWALSGDVIFAGSVGRTDLKGGDETQMRHSLRTISNALDPQTLLFPGHGPATTMAEEIQSNPYLIRARRIG